MGTDATVESLCSHSVKILSRVSQTHREEGVSAALGVEAIFNAETAEVPQRAAEKALVNLTVSILWTPPILEDGTVRGVVVPD